MTRSLDLSANEVRAVTERAYGLTVDALEPAAGEFATVYRVETGGGSLAFKALWSNAGIVEWQTSAMSHLAGLGLPVPAVTRTIDQQLTYVYPHQGGQVVVQLSAWLPDPPLHDVRLDAALLHDVGRTAGRVSNGLRGFRPPPTPVRHAWELQRCGETIRAALAQLPGSEVAGVAARAAARFDAEVAPALGKLPASVVHHDLHDANLLVGVVGEDRREITGILDFGDMTFGVRLAELAVAAAYAARNTTDPAAAILDVVAGWKTTEDLDARETRTLLPAAIARLGTNVAVWAQRSAGSRAEYARTRALGSTDALAALLAVDAEAFAEEVSAR